MGIDRFELYYPNLLQKVTSILSRVLLLPNILMYVTITGSQNLKIKMKTYTTKKHKV